jgi:hypothetical protein
MQLTDEDLKSITLSVLAALNSQRQVPEEQHVADHEFLKLMRVREETKQRLYNAMITHIAKWGAVGILTGLLAAGWLLLKQQLAS